MAKTKKTALTFEAVQEIGLELPGVESETSRGWPCLKANGKLFAWMPVKKDVEPGTLALRMDMDQRDALLQEAPETYYVTDHYAPYPAILVRLNRLDRTSLHDLLRTSHRFVTAKARKSRPRK